MKRRSFLACLPVVVLFGRLLGRRADPSSLPLQADWDEARRRMEAGEWLVFNNGRTCLTNPRSRDGGIQCDLLGAPFNFKWTC